MLHYPDRYAEARALAENKNAVLQTLKGSKEAELNSKFSISRIQTLIDGEENSQQNSNDKVNELHNLRARVYQLELSRKPRNSSLQCFSCGRHGHIARDCYAII